MSTTRTLFRILWIILMLRLLLSTELLNLMVPYTDPGGNPIFKIHPATYLTLLAGFWDVYTRFAPQGGRPTPQPVPIWLQQFLYIMSFVALVNVYRFGMSGMSYLADTFIGPIVYVILMTRLMPEERQRLARHLLVMLVISACMACIEFVIRTHIVPHGKYANFGHFRSSGLTGHPLNGALITAGLLPLFLLTPWSTRAKLFCVSVCMISILAFGARAALFIGGSIFLITILIQAVIMARKKTLSFSMVTQGYFLIIGGVAAVVGLMLFTGFGARFMELGLFSDESSQSRKTAFEILNYLTPKERWSGIDFGTYLQILEFNPELGIIENFWLNLMIGFGLPLFALFCFSFAWFVRGLSKNQGVLILSAILTFAIVASTSNSLSTKTIVFLLFAVAAYGLRTNPQTVQQTSSQS